MPIKAVILGVDPGLHTGYCLLELYADEQHGRTIPALKGHSVSTLLFGTVDGDEDTIKFFDSVAVEYFSKYDKTVPLLVACEHFVFTRTSMMGGSRNAVEMTGALKTVMALRQPRARVSTEQKPADAKLVSNAVLSDLGIKQRGDRSTDHAQMAARHAVMMSMRICKKITKLAV